jgi:hypothetical protein
MSGERGEMIGGGRNEWRRWIYERRTKNGWERDINKGYKLTTKRYEYEWKRRGESGGGGDVQL